MSFKNILITGTGSYVPSRVVKNEDFAVNQFFDVEGVAFAEPHAQISEKFRAITGIEERRHATDDQVCSDIATLAAQEAIKDANIDAETLDHIIVAHNFGDVPVGTVQTDMLPSIAAKVKNKLDINNPKCICYDVVFGCPGWIQGTIQARSFMQSGLAKRCLVIEIGRAHV